MLNSRAYALGDVIMRKQFTHAAEREASVVFQNAVLRLPRKYDDRALPWATFIEPEVATVGLSEPEARQRSPEVRVFRADFDGLDRARIDGLTQGFAKVMALPSGKILGATVLGEQAALIVQEFALAMEHGLTLQNIASTAHVYPTYACLALKLASQFPAARLERGFFQTALRWIYGFQPKPESGGGPQPSAPEKSASDLVTRGH